MILVEIRCKSCRALLTGLVREPRSWDGYTWVYRCARHGGNARGGPRPGALIRREQKIPNADLRPLFAKARRTGKTQLHLL